MNNETKQKRRSNLLELINKKLTDAKSAPKPKPKRKSNTDANVRTAHGSKRPPSTRAEADHARRASSSVARVQANRRNAAHSTGPRTPEGKSKASANSLKHGFYANVETLNPHDSPLFLDTHNNLRMGLQPDGPAEEHLIRELSMLSARLQRLESAEYALISSGIESNPKDTRELATSYINNDAHLEQLRKAELHLRRAYNRTFDRLERMQKERFKLTPEQAHKRSERWINTCKLTGSCPTCNPPDDFPTTPQPPTATNQASPDDQHPIDPPTNADESPSEDTESR